MIPGALARRTVRVPAPGAAAVLAVRRWTVERDGSLDRAISAALQDDARERPDGWTVVWVRHHIEVAARPVAARDVVEVAATGDDGGEHLAFVLAARLAAAGPAPTPSGPADLGDGSWAAVVARWGAWTAGPGLGAVRADMEPWKGLQAPHVLPAVQPAPSLCPACLADGAPLPLLGPGMPAPDGGAALAVALGEAAHLGCDVGTPHATARCRACGAGFVPGDCDAAEAVEALAGGIGTAVRLPGARAVWTVADRGIVVWSPSSALLGDHWWFALGAGTRARLDAASVASVALRPRGGAVVYAPWAAVGRAAAGRLHLRVAVDRPAVVRLPGGFVFEGVTDPGRIAGG